MSILEKIKNNWDFKKTTEQNVIHFSNEKEQKRRKLNKIAIWLMVIGIVLGLLSENSLLFIPFFIGAISYGSEYVFNNANNTGLTHIAVLDDTHFVVVYTAASDYGYAIIGTISSGNQISYGSAYQYNYASYDVSVTALDATHFVITYSDNSAGNDGFAIIGVVSNGNQIAYGSEYEFNNADTFFTSVAKIDATHFVVMFSHGGSSYRGYGSIGTISNENQIIFSDPYLAVNSYSAIHQISLLDSTHFVDVYTNSNGYGNAIVGTISGTSISFGSSYQFNGNNTPLVSVSALDATHFVIAYDKSDSDGYAVIGTVSNGNQISYGSEYEFNNADTYGLCVVSLSSSEFIISYAHSDNDGFAILGTVSSVNQIAYGTAYEFNNAETGFPSMSKISSTHFVISYIDYGNSNKGTAIIGNIPAPVSTFSHHYRRRLLFR